MDFKEFLEDAELHISTIGRDEKYSNAHAHPYEPTTYEVLERLAESGLIGADDHLLDYGSGKGRVPIYMNHRIGCRATGVECMEEFHEDAVHNLLAHEIGEKGSQKYNQYDQPDDDSESDITFVCARAQDYSVPDDVTSAFFFNPVSVSIMRSVLDRLLESYDRNPRYMRMFFYYPSDAYIAYLMCVDEVCFDDEIDCTDLFKENDPRNRVIIFSIGG